MPKKRTSAKRKTRVTTRVPVAKLDLYQKYRNEYVASQMPGFVRVGPAKYLSYAGRGKPGDSEFTTGFGAVYTVAFMIKMAFKAAGQNYGVTKPEALWWNLDAASGAWDWQLLMRVPPFVTGKDLTVAIDQLIERGKPDAVRTVQLVELRESTCVQILHVGPYSEEAGSIAKMREFAERAGRTFSGKHHEIYLSDPRRVAPEKIRTILRQPVS